MKTWNVMKRLAWTASLCVASSLALAQANGQRLFLDLKDADIYSALAALSRQTGLSYVVAKTGQDQDFGSITLSLRDATPEEALKNICIAAGATAKRDSNGVFVVSFGTDSGTGSNSSAIEVVPQKPITLKIHPRKVDGYDIFRQITGRFEFDPESGLKEMTALRSLTYRPTSPTAYNPTPYNGGSPKSNLQTAQQGVEPTVNGNVADQLWMPGGSSRQLSGGGGGSFGQPGAGGGGGQPGGGGAGGAGGGAVTLTPGEGLVPEGIDYISYDPSDGSIIVQGTSDAINELRSLIDLFDVRPKQVLITVEFVTTSQSLSKSFGIDWQLSRGAVFTGTRSGSFARPGDPIFLNYATGNLVTRLRANLLEGDGKVVNAPIVRTLNNQVASVAQIATTTIFVPVNSQGQTTNIVTYNPISLPIQSGLTVRPRINNDGSVTMSLNPNISEFGQIRRAPDGTEVPDTLNQTISVSTIVNDGETIVLGGLNRSQYSNSVIRFPILSEIPIIGQFFRSTVTERNDQELLIFVTPRIIKEEESGFNLGP